MCKGKKHLFENSVNYFHAVSPFLPSIYCCTSLSKLKSKPASLLRLVFPFCILLTHKMLYFTCINLYWLHKNPSKYSELTLTTRLIYGSCKKVLARSTHSFQFWTWTIKISPVLRFLSGARHWDNHADLCNQFNFWIWI